MTPVSCRCKNPYMRGNLPFGCGQCMPCRIRKRRLWAHRLMLENRLHGDSCFLTLTYDPNLPTFPQGGSLVPKHLTDFLKRLRRNYTTNSLRYFAVGEYGEQSQHPHYHALLFGYPTCSGARCQDKSGRYACQACALVRYAWGKGHILLGDVTKDSASYVAGYVTKGLTHLNSYTSPILNGRHPEFSRMSRKPGIGHGVAKALAEHMNTPTVFSEIFFGKAGDVPSVVTTDQKDQPVGRYLKKVMRQTLGWPNPEKTPEGVLDGWQEEMRQLFKANFEGAPFTPDASQKKLFLIEQNRDAILNIEAKFKLFNLKGAL